MSLLAPLFLLGLLAALVPWWLHRLSANNPPEQDFGSTRFLEATPSTSSKKRRTRYWLLLALRVLFLGLLSLLFAQPVIEKLKSAGASNARHILLLDTSLSQNHGDRWQRSLTIANDVLDQAAATDEAVIIAASDQFVQSQTDNSVESARTQLTSIKPDVTRLDYGRIASAVASVVAESNISNHLHIITDAQASALPERFTSLAVDKVAKISVYSSANEQDRNISVNGKLEQARDGIATVVAIVNNYGPATTTTLQVRSNNTLLTSTELSLEANARLVHRFDSIDVSDADSQLKIEISPADSLPEDDSWLVPLPNKEQSELTIIVGNNEQTVSSVYVKAAIESDPRFAARIVESGRFSKSDVGDLVIIPDAAALTDAATKRLKEYVEEGGNALVAVGATPHSGQALNLLGIKNQQNQSNGYNAIGAVDESHPVTNGLQKNWRSISVIKNSQLQMQTTDRSIIDFSNGSPLLVEKRLGAGKMLVLSTALDTSWTDLPTESVFVAFVIKSIDYLGGDTTATAYRSTGEAITVAAGAQLLDPKGEPMRDLSDISSRTTIRLDKAGIYQMRYSTGTQSIAVNSDARESDIKTIDSETLNKWQQMAVSTPVETSAAQTQHKNHKGFWLWLLPLLLLLALLESFYSHRHLWIRREV